MIDNAVAAAEAAFETYCELPPANIAEFLDRAAGEIAALGDALIATAAAETALATDRLNGERARTVSQLRLFAEVVRNGEWKDVRIDSALPDRKPLRRPDLRRTLIPIGPVAVWAASNFPLAFSVAGGDTASALAAGCPVILKAHPGHPRTSALAAGAIARAIEASGLPAGVFTMVEGASPDVSVALVRHPGVKAAAFTGSLEGEDPVPALFETRAQTLLANPELGHEVFGPSAILVRCESQAELDQVGRALEGSLTAALHGTEADLRAQSVLLKILARKAGRLIFNGYPTGVEVCAAMQHGGPYPSSTDPRFTSVGTAAIVRFARPICYQDFPVEFLPAELRRAPRLGSAQE